MNISSLNSYNNVGFTAKNAKAGKYARQGQHARGGAHAAGNYSKKSVNQVKKAGIAVALVGTIVGSILGIKGCQANTKNETDNTMPSYTITETYLEETTETTQPTQAPVVNVNHSTMRVTTLPIEEREPKWHTVVKGDRLADIVKHYAEIDKNTPDYELVPYYEILEQDNPGKWSDRNNIHLGISFRVDGILPENRTDSYIGTAKPTDPTEATTEPTEPRPTSPEDTVEINGNIYQFDINSKEEALFGITRGLINGKCVELNESIGGGYTETHFIGASNKGEKIQEISYDKDGKKSEVVEYLNGSAESIRTYSYKPTTYVETIKDLTTNRNQISVIETTYSNSDNSIISRVFKSAHGTVATFDFEHSTLEIGEGVKKLDFNYDSFKCNDDKIGSAKYTAGIEYEDVRIDVLKNGISIEYIDGNGNITSRELYDAKAELINIE